MAPWGAAYDGTAHKPWRFELGGFIAVAVVRSSSFPAFPRRVFMVAAPLRACSVGGWLLERKLKRPKSWPSEVSPSGPPKVKPH
jgi:hypothetical protein